MMAQKAFIGSVALIACPRVSDNVTRSPTSTGAKSASTRQNAVSARAIAGVRAEVSPAPGVIAGRNPPAPHTTPRRTRGAFALTDLTLRIQQTLEALDIFRAVAGSRLFV